MSLLTSPPISHVYIVYQHHTIVCVCVCVCVCAQSCPTLCDPMDCSPPGSTVHGILQARILEWVAISLSKGSSQLRDWAQVSRTAGRVFTTEPPGNPKNTGVGSLSLLQGIFPTPELNRGLTHCRWTLYRLIYRESPHVQPSQKKGYKWTYLQIQNRLRDLKIRLVVTKGETWGEVIN